MIFVTILPAGISSLVAYLGFLHTQPRVLNIAPQAFLRDDFLHDSDLLDDALQASEVNVH